MKDRRELMRKRNYKRSKRKEKITGGREMKSTGKKKKKKERNGKIRCSRN